MSDACKHFTAPSIVFRPRQILSERPLANVIKSLIKNLLDLIHLVTIIIFFIAWVVYIITIQSKEI